ncbi:MAG: Aspartokinase [Myxococcaceae bacterium]|nr:Aspartokinase [Myxococcaceae bacterium]
MGSEISRDARVFLVGTGVVGNAVLAIAHGTTGTRPAGLELVGVANTRASRIVEAGSKLEEADARAVVTAPTGGEAVVISDDVLDALAKHPHPVLVDATAADGMEDLYVRALERGIHVVTANKKPLVAPWPKRQRLFDTTRRKDGARFRYEATVGAGLPVIETLKDLVRTGDRVRRIECVLSGTLGFVANAIHAGTPLSRAVATAKDRGYTEPDPREDLLGTDVARKVVILARELGAALELGDVDLQPFVHASVRNLEDVDAELAVRVNRLRGRGEKLVYLARVDVDADGTTVRASAGPVAVAADHPAATLGGSSALVAFTTARYDRDPLVVRGSGAGGAVTASALFSDVLKATGQT